MESDVVYGYYSSIRAKLLKKFHNTPDPMKPFLIERYGLEQTQTLADDCSHWDFRFFKGTPTRISSKTPEVNELIKKNLNSVAKKTIV
jgi:hypothetical protein